MNELENPWKQVLGRITRIVAQTVSLPSDDVAQTMEIPPNPALGDVAYTVAFRLAKELRKNPVQIAAELSEKLRKILPQEPLVRRVESKGPYLNIFLDPGQLAKLVVSAVQVRGAEYGTSTEYNGIRALIESPAVNPSKPWHIGHARNAVIGDTLCNILQAAGQEVVRLDYINDLGLQIAQLVWKLRNTDEKWTEGKYDHYLGRLYVGVQEAFENDKRVEEEIRETSRNLELLDSEAAKASARMVADCLKSQNQTSYRLGIYHDYQVWESAIAHSGLLERAKKMMLECECVTKLETGEMAGCTVVMLDKLDEFKDMQEPYKVLFRSDGTRTYTGADLAFQMWKFGIVKDPFQYELFEKQPNKKPVFRTVVKGQRRRLGKFDYVFNVIAAGQAHPQKLIYTILDLLGYKEQSANSRHVAYEFVGLEDVDFSGRKGTWIGYTCDDVLDKLEEMARKEVEKRNPEASEKSKADVAKRIAVGALRYFMLKASPERKIVFRWNEALDFNGDAGPYLQYSVARAQRIVEKTQDEEPVPADLTLLSSEPETALVKAISRFPHEVQEIARAVMESTWETSFTSNRLTTYGYELATLFSKFYDSCPVLKGEPEVRAARLELVRAFKATMTNCLALLGIPVVERM